MTDPFGSDRPGTLGEQTAWLLDSAQDWARRAFAESASATHPGGSDCQWCPLCRLAAVLRGERPEVTARVAEAGAAVVSALRAILDAAAPVATTDCAAAASAPADSARADSARADSARADSAGVDPLIRSSRSGGPRVQRIDLTDPR